MNYKIYKYLFFDFIKANKQIFFILLISFIIKISFWIALKPWNSEVISNIILICDAQEYDQLAKSFLNDKSFKNFDSFRTPGYPLFLAFLYFISLKSIHITLLLQLFLSLISIVILYKIATTIFSKKIGLLASFIFAIDLHQALYSVTVLTETFFVFILLCSIYFLVVSIKKKAIYSICLSAFFMGIATLTRPIGLFFPFVILLFIFIFSDFAIKKKFHFSFLFCAFFYLTISPWLYHNYIKYNTAKLSTIEGRKILFTNVAYAEANKYSITLEQARNKLYDQAKQEGIDTTKFNTFENSKIYTNMAKKYIQNNLGLYSKMHFMGIIDLYMGLATNHMALVLNCSSKSELISVYEKPNIFTRIFDFFQKKSAFEIALGAVLILFLLINYCFGIIGGIFLFKEKNAYFYLFILIILYFTAITGPMGLARFRLPFMPFINLICAAGILTVREKIILKKKQE